MTSIHTKTLGAGPEPVVFVHGLFGQGRNFTQIAKSLGDVATSLLVDLPDHGRSDHSDQFSLDDYADALAAPIAAHAHSLGRRGVTLVGHSLGGKVAMRFALRHPELVERLLVADISPVPGWANDTFTTIIPALRGLDLATVESRADADAQLARDIDSPVVRGFLLQNLRHEHHRWRWQMNLALLADSIDAIGDWPRPDATTSASYGGPVLWISGQRSPYVRPEHAPVMRTLFPRTRQITIKDAGHWVHADQPAVFTEIVRRFIGGGLSPASPG